MTERREAPTICFDIFMAGDIAQAKQAIRGYCLELGFCVHVEPCDFIYTGGEETGFKVGIINYPRFSDTKERLYTKAEDLALRLMEACCQHSFSIVGPETTVWYSRR